MVRDPYCVATPNAEFDCVRAPLRFRVPGPAKVGTRKGTALVPEEFIFK